MTHTEFSSRRINLLIVVISSMMMLIVANLPFKAKPFGDITFHEEAKNLALYIKGKTSYEKVTISKAPGPVLFYLPAYLSAPADASDDTLWVYGVVFTSVIITISLMLIFSVAAAFFSKEIGVLAVFLFFIFPIHCYYSLGIMAEAPAFFSLALALYGWSKAFFKPERLYAWAIFCTGMLFLIINRPNTLLLLGLGLFVVAYSWLSNKTFFQRYGKNLTLSLIVIGVAGIGVLQSAKAITQSKTEMNQSVLLYYVAHQGRFQFRDEPLDFRFWDNEVRPDSKDYQDWVKSEIALSDIIDKTGHSYGEVYKAFLVNDALEHPFLFTRQFFVKCFYGNIYFINSVKPESFHLGPFKGASGYSLFILLINIINLIIIFGAVKFLFQQHNLINYWIFWGVIVALLIFHGLTYMEPRYIFPSKAALYIMSAAGLYRFGFIKKATDRIAVYLFPNANHI